MTSPANQVRLDNCVTAVWRREQMLRLTHGALAMAAWAVALFLVGLLIDWTLSLPGPLRGVWGLAVIGVGLYHAWQAGWKELRPFDAVHTALQIERHHGGMNSLLVSAVQFRAAAAQQGFANTLTQLTCRQAEEAATSLRAEQVVRYEPLRKPAMVALVALVVIGGLFAWQSTTVKIGAMRMFAPWLAIEYPTRTQLNLLEGDLVVQEGQSVRLAAQLAGVIPRKAQIALRTGDSRPRLQELPIVDAACEYPIETVFREFNYRFKAGDATSAWHTVRVIPPPNIAEAQVTLDYPAYTQRASQTVGALTITVPETTNVQWNLTLDRTVSEAQVQFAGQAPMPMTVSDDGRTVSFQQVAANSRAYSFTWVERDHGFVYASPSYYLQVSPDRAPRVELTSPGRNLYATLGRKLDLAYRCRDDHGIAEAAVIYSVDKIEEQKVPFTPPATPDAGEQTINWDYRAALPELVEGQTVSFAVEAVDHYPGDQGPHRARSEARRITFVSREDYLANIERQKTRLLSRLKAVYKEQRQAYEVVLHLAPADALFIQNCQLEAVRQDLVGERLNKLAGQIRELTEDLSANGIADDALTGSLDRLRQDILNISSDHIAKASQSLRTLASQTAQDGGNGLYGMSDASGRVDGAARELGLLVLQLGYQDAADVMAREMHAAAQNQAALRLLTIMAPDQAAPVADAQRQLGDWLARLFKASPNGSESTPDDALIEFTLTRLVKQLIRSDIQAKTESAATLIREGRNREQAARLQEQVIAALLKAEFRLRVGSEREALAKAMNLFESQAQQQRELREQIAGLRGDEFTDRHDALAQAQASIQDNLYLLLMPEIAAPRPRLFDDVFPAAPPVSDRLAEVDLAVAAAVSSLQQSDREAARAAQIKAEQAYAALATIVRNRITAMTQAVRIERMSYGALEIDEKLTLFSERQLSLLEKTEDAVADQTESNYLSPQQKSLADEVEEVLGQISRSGLATGSNDGERALSNRLEQAVQAMRQSVPVLADNQPDKATAPQISADAAINASRELLAVSTAHLGAYASMLKATQASVAPSPYVGEIEQEQRDLLQITQKTPAANLPTLALAQKNLIHAVDAILVALDPVSHLVETGTVMLFAKADMDAAGVALDDQDPVEAVDAQQFIVETLQTLRAKIDAVIPQYQYLLEVVEALHDSIEEGLLIQEAQRQLRGRLTAGPDQASAMAAPQRALVQRTQNYGRLLDQIAGPEHLQTAIESMSAAAKSLTQSNKTMALSEMVQAQSDLEANTADLLKLMEHLTFVLAAPEPGAEISPELKLLRDVLSLAAKQKTVYRRSGTDPSAPIADIAPKLREIETACEPFIELAKQHKVPEPDEDDPDAAQKQRWQQINLEQNLVDAKAHMAKAAQSAAASDRAKAMARQKDATESLRHFVVQYAMIFVAPPGDAGPQDPAPTNDFNESDDPMALFLPGAVTGNRPPDGRLEWQVLGKRDRAALNENFARELPLEFRAILKDYYERLAK